MSETFIDGRIHHNEGYLKDFVFFIGNLNCQLKVIFGDFAVSFSKRYVSSVTKIVNCL